jgi:hypothetical protein
MQLDSSEDSTPHPMANINNNIDNGNVVGAAVVI